MNFNCSYKELLNIDNPKIIPNPKNNNRHTIEQIKRLAKIIEYQGQRSPIVISNLSGFIVKGHCRLQAIKELGWSQIAVDYQDYQNEAQEYADMTADNEIARWAELDYHQVYTELEELELGNVDLLGIENFNIPQASELDDILEDAEKRDFAADAEAALQKGNKTFSITLTNDEYTMLTSKLQKIMDEKIYEDYKTAVIELVNDYFYQ